MTTADIADQFQPGQWEFTPAVVAEFDQHVRQSVPFYDVIQDAVAELSDWLAPDGSLIVDMGCSTGTTLAAILARHPDRQYDLIGYDTSQPMLDAAKAKIGAHPFLGIADPIDAGRLAHTAADLTLALFTLQFLPAAARTATLLEARRSSSETGAILIAEKLRVPDSRWAEVATELSWDVKAVAGIPSESIRAKARALRGVLTPGSSDELTARLLQAGWHAPTCLFRWHQWALYGAFACPAGK